MSLLGWIIVGLLAGGIGRRLAGTRKQGCVTTTVIGIIGAFIGGGLYRLVRGPHTHVLTSFDLGSILVAILGAVVFLMLLNALGGSRRRGR